MKRTIEIMLFLIILFGLFSVSVAEETHEEETMVVSGVSEEDIDNDLLFNMYAESLFGYGAPSFYRANHNFSEDMQEFYDFLVTCIKEVAAGERTSTEFTIEKAYSFTQKELYALVNGLMYAYPYEMYWYDEYLGGCSATITRDSTTFRFSVLKEYAADKYVVDTTRIAVAKTAAENTRKIIEKYADCTDMQKLIGYKNEICDMVEYNWGVIYGDMSHADQNAWHLIYVFDADPATSVVCEGYAKAFQYLCDLTSFEGDVYCYTVTGYMGDEAHAWNLVHLSDGKVYLVDVTNIDDEYGSYNNKLFLAGYEYGDIENGYAYRIDSKNVVCYRFSEISKMLFSEEDLALSEGYYFDESGTERTSGEWNYVLSGGEASIVGYGGTKKDVLVPDVIDGYHVSEIRARTFYGNDYIETLVISEGVEWISYGFAGFCNNLTSISFPSTLCLMGTITDNWVLLEGLVDYCRKIETIAVDEANPYMRVVDNVLYDKEMTKLIFYPRQNKASVFYVPEEIRFIRSAAFEDNPYLTEVYLPNTVKEIGKQAFEDCTNLKKANIPHGCTDIGRNVFSGTSLLSIHIPASVQQLGNRALMANELAEITVDKENQYYYALDNVLFTYEGELIRYAPNKTDEFYEIPVGIHTIGGCAFSGAKNLKEMVIPNGINEIESYAFEGCEELVEIVLPDSVRALDSGMFSYCFSLAKIVIPSSVVALGDNIFSYDTVIYGDNGSVAQQWAEERGIAFHDRKSAWAVSGTFGDKITWTLSEDGVLSISGTGSMESTEAAPWSMYSMMIKEVIFQEGITSIPNYGFRYCLNLTEITLPKTITNVGAYAFYMCRDLEYIVLPNGITALGTYAFGYCENLKSIELPEGISVIQNGVFNNCKKLSDISLPDSIEYIGEYAFYRCTELEQITLLRNVYFIGENAFGTCTSLTVTVIPLTFAHEFLEKAGVSLRLADGPEWAQNAITWGECGTNVKWALFEDGSLILSGEGAMDDKIYKNGQPWRKITDRIHKVVIEEGITTVSKNAFSDLSMLEEVILASTISSIEENAFSGCENVLKLIVYFDMGTSNEMVRTILKEMPKIRTAGPIGSGCDYEFTCGDTIPQKAFYNLQKLTGITIPSGVVSIGDRAFEYCVSTTVITLPDGLMKIGSDVFNRCNQLELIQLPSTLTSIGAGAFAYCPALKEMIIPDSVTSIGQGAFNQCAALESVTFGSSLMKIPEYMFGKCSNLSKIVLRCPLDADEFRFGIIFSDDDYANLKTAGPIGSGCNFEFVCNDKIANMEFYARTDPRLAIEEMILPDSVATIEAYAFSGMSNLKKITIPAGVKTIDYRAFQNCASLEKIVFLGDFPSINANILEGTVTTAVYPACNVSWSDDALMNYGGTVKWAADDTPHTEIVLEAVLPNCTEEGMTEGLLCTHCGRTLIEQEILPAIGHTEVIIDAVEATCLETGMTEKVYCSVCNEVLKEPKNVPAKGHAVVVDEALAPTCTENGFTEGKNCAACDAVIAVRESIPALGHTEITFDEVKPTCTREGFTEGTKCSVCGEVFYASNVIPALGHTEAELASVAPTCTEIGFENGIGCSVCGEVLSAGTAIPALGHTEIALRAVQPTCTENGLTEGIGCAVCAEVIVEQKIVLAVGHTEEEIAAIPPVDDKAGYTAGLKCAVCNEILKAPEIVYDTIQEGKCGTNVYWKLFNNGTLRITGNGSITQYAQRSVPWYEYRDSIVRVEIDEGVTSISDYCFYDCKTLKSITIGSTVTSMSQIALSGCDNVEKIIAYCPMGSNNYELRKLISSVMTRIKTAGPIGSGCDYEFVCEDTIASNAFASLKSLEKVIVPDTVISIESGAFINCSALKEVVLPEGIESIGASAFLSCTSLSEVKLPSTVTAIGEKLFYGCSALKNIVIPDGVSVIESSVFSKCSSLEEVTLGSSAATVNGSLFESCPSIKKLILRCPLDADGFQLSVVLSQNCAQNLNSAGPIGSGSDLEFACNSIFPANEFNSPGRFAFEEVILPDNITSVGINAFYGMSSLRRIILPENLEVIEKYAFKGCASMEEVIFHNKLANIQDEAFSGCAKISKLEIPSSVKEIGSYAFSDCASIEEIRILGEMPTMKLNPFTGCTNVAKLIVYSEMQNSNIGIRYLIGTAEKVKTAGPIGGGYDYEFVCGDTLPDNAFYGLVSIEKITLPENVTAIGTYSFANCDKLKDIELHEGITVIGDGAFRKCISLNSITLPESLVSIGEYAFEGCAGIEEIVIPDQVEKIGRDTFSDCTALQKVTLGYSTSDLSGTAFENCPNLGCLVIKCPLDANEFKTNSILTYCYFSNLKTAGPFGSACDIWYTCNEKLPSNAFVFLTGGRYGAELEEIILADGVVTIENMALIRNGDLRRVTIPASVKTIGDQIVSDCTSLDEVVFLGDLPAIANYSFTNASTNVIYPGCNGTWDEKALKNYGGALNWIASDAKHTEAVLKAIDPTCTENGTTEGMYCASCGKVLIAQIAVAAKGHKEDVFDAVAPTCTGSGLTEGRRCSVCEEILLEQNVIEALGHSVVIDEATEPTCIADGVTEGTHCSVCQQVLVQQRIAPALGHEEMIDEVVVPTCTETGLTEGKHCTVCNEVLLKQETIPALGHSEVIDKSVTPTCTKTGLTEGKHCSVCGEVLLAQDIIPAFGHSEVIDEAVGATCTESGLTEGKHCSVCDEIIIMQKMIQATGHISVTDAAVGATCTQSGLTEGSHCGVCGEIFAVQDVVPSMGHDVVTDNAVEPTCTATGLTEGKHCVRCDEILTEQMSVPALGHTAVADPAVEPTCTETGLTAGSHCAVCGKVFAPQQTIPEIGHVPVTDNAVPPTCTEPGKTQGSYCIICNEVLVSQEEISALGHSEEVIEGKASTCTETGLTEGKKCSVCGVTTVEQEEIATLGHDETLIPAIPATHITTGLTEGKSCSRCGEVFAIQTEIPVVDVVKTYLPVGLETVRKYAFASTAVECVILSENCKRVEALAFAGCAELRFVEIPLSVEFIDDTAFEGCPADLVIVTTEGSFAHAFAQEKGIAFVLI